MTSSRTIFFFLILMVSSLTAGVKYEQEISFTSLHSEKEPKDMVNQFMRAACGDPDLQVVGVKYEEEKLENCISYTAIVTCHVSNMDKDVYRIQQKVIQNNKDLLVIK